MTVALQVGEHEPGVAEAVAPLGRPDTDKLTDFVLPDTSVAVIALVTDAPRTTLLAPSFVRLKSNDELPLDTVIATGEDVVVLLDVSLATAVRLCEPFTTVVVFQVMEYGEDVSSEPIATPSTMNCTPATPALSDAVAETGLLFVLDDVV